MSEPTVKERWDLMERSTKVAIAELQDILSLVLERWDRYAINEKQAALLVESMEYTLQSLWGFDLNPNKHAYWYKIKGCTCPKIDNEERFGFGRIVSDDCKFHGGEYDISTN